MAVSLRTNFCVFDPIVTKKERVVGHSSSEGFFSSSPSKTSNCSELRSHFKGEKVVLSKGGGVYQWRCKTPSKFTIQAQQSFCTSRALRWWDKNLKPNMMEINSAQELVNSLSNAGDKLVILDFYSPGCGGCKALHPKICQIAEANPDVQFLKVNYEEHRSMCQSLHVHVLPFFRFYRGAEGRLCSFSCTVATIKKFKDALAKHGTERCSLGPAKGLEESELLSLAANREISFTSPHPAPPVRSVSRETEEFALANK